MKTAEAVIWGAGLAGAGVAGFYVWKNYFAAVEPEFPPAVAETASAPAASTDQATVTGYVKGRPVTLVLASIGNGKMLRTDAAAAFLSMAAEARQAGVTLVPVSGFRSMDEQRALHAGYVANKPGFNPAAQPGFSNHQGGISVDVNTQSYTSKNFMWLAANAKRFGFKNDVPKEHWHWTFQGASTLSGSSAVSGLAGLGAETPATLVSAGAVGGTSVLVLAGIGAGLWFLTRDGGSSSSGDAETECREAAERWVPKCVIQKGKRKRQS